MKEEASAKIAAATRLVNAALAQMELEEDPDSLRDALALRSHIERQSLLTAYRIHQRGWYSLSYLAEVFGISKQALFTKFKTITPP